MLAPKCGPSLGWPAWTAAVAALISSMMLVPVAWAATVDGTAGADVLTGTERADEIRARAGNDVVYARGGNDQVYPGPGSDVARLGDGADRVFVPDSLRSERDWVYGGRGPDVTDNVWFASLGPGNDRYRSRWSCQEVRLGRGDDRASHPSEWNGIGDCDIFGGPGRDLVRWDGTDAPGSHYVTVLDGGTGADTLRGGYNEDHLVGGDGPDQLYPYEFTWSDHVFAGPGDDHIHLSNADASSPIRGGPGIDTVHDWDGVRELRSIEIVNP